MPPAQTAAALALRPASHLLQRWPKPAAPQGRAAWLMLLSAAGANCQKSVGPTGWRCRGRFAPLTTLKRMLARKIADSGPLRNGLRTCCCSVRSQLLGHRRLSKPGCSQASEQCRWRGQRNSKGRQKLTCQLGAAAHSTLQAWRLMVPALPALGRPGDPGSVSCQPQKAPITAASSDETPQTRQWAAAVWLWTQ